MIEDDKDYVVPSTASVDSVGEVFYFHLNFLKISAANFQILSLKINLYT